jgi:hypothetical protein
VKKGFFSFLTKTKKRAKAGDKSLTKTAPLSLPDALIFDNPKAGLDALRALVNDYYMGRCKSEMARTICFIAQTEIGYLRAGIELETLRVEQERLELDMRTRELDQLEKAVIRATTKRKNNPNEMSAEARRERLHVLEVRRLVHMPRAELVALLNEVERERAAQKVDV